MGSEDYTKETKARYQSADVAERYKHAYTRPRSFRGTRVALVAAREQEAVREFLNDIKESLVTVLDVPAGTGKMTAILLERGLQVTSGDISQEMMHLIDPELKKSPNYAGEKVMDATALPFPDKHFDLIVNIRLMHRVDPTARRKVLEEAHRVAGQYCIMSFAVKNIWHDLRLAVKQLFGKSDSSPGRAPVSALERGLRNIGFQILKRKRVLPILSNEIIFLLKV